MVSGVEGTLVVMVASVVAVEVWRELCGHGGFGGGSVGVEGTSWSWWLWWWQCI